MNQSDDIFRLLLLLSKYRSPLLEFFFFVFNFFPSLSLSTSLKNRNKSIFFFVFFFFSFSFFPLFLFLCYCCFRLFSCILEVLVFLFSLLFTHLKITLYYIDLINMISFLFYLEFLERYKNANKMQLNTF